MCTLLHYYVTETLSIWPEADYRAVFHTSPRADIKRRTHIYVVYVPSLDSLDDLVFIAGLERLKAWAKMILYTPDKLWDCKTCTCTVYITLFFLFLYYIIVKLCRFIKELNMTQPFIKKNKNIRIYLLAASNL